MAKDTRTLHVVTHQRWIADDFAAAPPDGWQVRHSNGLDVPAVGPGDALWAPMAWVARAYRSGMSHPLAAPTPLLADLIAPHHLKRPLVTMTLRVTERMTAKRPVFAKLAMMKHEGLPAQWYADVGEFRCAAQKLGASESTMVSLCWDRMHWLAEYRLFVAGGHAVGASRYLVRDPATGEPTLWSEELDQVPAPQGELAEAIDFGEQVLVDPVARPSLNACTLDVGWSPDTGWSVIEVNPAWCSAVYGTSIDAAWRSVLDANSPAPQSLWTPDPWLRKIAGRQTPLSIRTDEPVACEATPARGASPDERRAVLAYAGPRLTRRTVSK